MNRFVQLKNRWLKDSVPVNVPASPTEIQRFECKQGITLPQSFKAYLSVMNGMAEGATDRDMMSFFSLEAIERQDPLPPAKEGEVNLAFADYCLASHVYLMRLSKSTEASPVIVSDGESERQIAASFDEFIDAYLQAPTHVAHCWS
jgi:hypothetical protein